MSIKYIKIGPYKKRIPLRLFLVIRNFLDFFLHQKRLIILRLDAIGDYVLFRNFIEVLKKSHEFKHYKFILCGNENWRELSEKFDNKYISDYIWVKPTALLYNNQYYNKIALELKYIAAHILIHPTYSRVPDVDGLARESNAKIKIASIGNHSNIKETEKIISDKFYTRLLPAQEDFLFEFDRNNEFFSHLLNTHTPLERPVINNSPDKKTKNHIVLYLDASASHKRWHWSNFYKLATFILNTFDVDIFLCGGPNNMEDANNFLNLDTKRVVNMVNKTSLPELLSLINNAKLVITNDTCTLHFAAVADTRVICISNGTGFGRFHPYPPAISEKVNMVYVDEIKNNFNDFNSLCKKYSTYSDLDINSIKPEEVFDLVKKILCE